MIHFKREHMVYQNNILPRVLPFAVYIFFLAFSDYLSPLWNAVGIDSKWLYALRVVLVLMALLYFWRDYCELTIKPLVKDFAYAGIAGLLVFSVWILPYPAWATLGNHVQAFNPILAQYGLWLSIRLLGAALIVPVMEELFWRSFLMRWIDDRNFLKCSPISVSLFALVISSGLFASAHHLWLAGLLAGLVYGAMYIKYKNLWIPIIAHAVTNGVLGVWVILTAHWQYW
jgi:CAAX prenyl protease-like protein